MKHFLKNKGKRLTAAVLSAVMCLMALPMSAFAWTSEEGKACTSYFGEKYVGSDGEHYYSKSTTTSLFYNEDGSTYRGMLKRRRISLHLLTGARSFPFMTPGCRQNTGIS